MKTTAQPLPELAVVPLESLHVHEEVDERRLKTLIDSLVQDGLLKNPPVALSLGYEGGFVVLDGVHRTLALSRLGLSHALVQVIRLFRDEPVIDTWTQVILDCELNDLLHAVQQSIGLEKLRSQVSPEHGALQVSPPLAWLCCPGGGVWAPVCEPKTLESRASILHTLISACDRLSRIERASERDEHSLRALFPELTAWVLLHPFTLEEIRLLADSGVRLPAGITRCMFSPRALRVNFPLEMLNGSTTDPQRSDQLDTWLRERIARRGVRYYSEPTYLFDE